MNRRNLPVDQSHGRIYFGEGSPRSKALFEPMVGIRLVVEGFHFLVAAVSVQLDGFNEGAVRFQVKNRNSRFPCVALQSLQETPP